MYRMPLNSISLVRIQLNLTSQKMATQPSFPPGFSKESLEVPSNDLGGRERGVEGVLVLGGLKGAVSKIKNI
jgi:hypothetical protein